VDVDSTNARPLHLTWKARCCTG